MRQGNQIIETAGGFELVVALERFLHRDHIGRAALVDQARDGAKNHPVLVAVEIFAHHHIGNAVPRGIFQQAAEHRLLYSIECGGSDKALTSRSSGGIFSAKSSIMGFLGG